MLDPSLLDALAALDTPTICNALEVVEPSRRGRLQHQAFVCARPSLAPIVGYPHRAYSGATQAESIGQHDRLLPVHPEGGEQPSVVLIEDLDTPAMVPSGAK